MCITGIVLHTVAFAGGDNSCSAASSLQSLMLNLVCRCVNPQRINIIMLGPSLQPRLAASRGLQWRTHVLCTQWPPHTRGRALRCASTAVSADTVQQQETDVALQEGKTAQRWVAAGWEAWAGEQAHQRHGRLHMRTAWPLQSIKLNPGCCLVPVMRAYDHHDVSNSRPSAATLRRLALCSSQFRHHLCSVPQRCTCNGCASVPSIHQSQEASVVRGSANRQVASWELHGSHQELGAAAR